MLHVMLKHLHHAMLDWERMDDEMETVMMVMMEMMRHLMPLHPKAMMGMVVMQQVHHLQQ